MKILKKYANGGSTKGDGTPRKPIHIRKPKERGNPFNTGTGSKYRKLADKMKKRQGPARGGTEPHNSFEMKGRKYMGGGKMKEYGHGGTTGRAPGDQKNEKQRARLRKRFGGGSSTGGRGGVEGMDTASFKKMREERRRRKIEKENPGGYKGRKMEFGGVGKEKPSRFKRKFAKKRKQYDKDVRKGKTKEAPHERTFKFRPDGQSVFKKRKKYNVENEPELRKRKRSERHEKITKIDKNEEGRYPDTEVTEDTPPSRPSKRPNTPNTEDGPRRPRFENGGTTGRVPGGQKDERQRDRLRRRGSRIRDRRRKQIREGKSTLR